MAGLAAIERFFERLFERPAARLFSPRVELAVLQRQLERGIETARSVRGRRSYVPGHYRILLQPLDLGSFGADAATIEAQLAVHVRTYARSRGYLLAARPQVVLVASERAPAGSAQVFAEAPVEMAEEPPTGGPMDVAAVDAGTSVFSVASPASARAVIVVRVPGAAADRVPVRPGTMRIGRAADNDLALADDRVSRHHGQIGVRHGTLIYRDLGSTNGTLVNGRRVTEIALGPGDTLQLGSSTLTIEPAG
jgi:hypothetical protein